MLLVLFNKIRVHSYHTVLCWFFVSSLAPLNVNNNPVNDLCVGVTTLGSGSWFTAIDRRLGLHSRQQVGVRVRVSTSRQEALRLPRRLCGCARNRKRKSIVDVPRILMCQKSTITTVTYTRHLSMSIVRGFLQKPAGRALAQTTWLFSRFGRFTRHYVDSETWIASKIYVILGMRINLEA